MKEEGESESDHARLGEGTERDIGPVLYGVIRAAAAMTLAPSTMQASSHERRVKGLSP